LLLTESVLFISTVNVSVCGVKLHHSYTNSTVRVYVPSFKLETLKLDSVVLHQVEYEESELLKV
jgi:hypothetical protein